MARACPVRRAGRLPHCSIGACSAFTAALKARMVASRPRRPRYIGVLQAMSLKSASITRFDCYRAGSRAISAACSGDDTQAACCCTAVNSSRRTDWFDDGGTSRCWRPFVGLRSLSRERALDERLFTADASRDGRGLFHREAEWPHPDRSRDRDPSRIRSGDRASTVHRRHRWVVEFRISLAQRLPADAGASWCLRTATRSPGHQRPFGSSEKIRIKSPDGLLRQFLHGQDRAPPFSDRFSTRELLRAFPASAAGCSSWTSRPATHGVPVGVCARHRQGFPC